jgi:tetratricopeptide (TPR) repeat protein
MAGNNERFQQAMNKGHSAAWDQSWADAANYYRQALEEVPNHPKALASLALALYQQKDFDQALEFYRQAAVAAPTDAVPLEKSAEIYERLGNVNQAANALLAAAELYIKAKDVNKAIESWSNVLSLKPDNMVARSKLAMVYEHLGRKPQAVAEYLAIASLLQNAGNVQNALQAVNRALTVQPDSAEASQALAMLKAGQLLPKPQRPRGATGPLLMAQVKEQEVVKKPEDTVSSYDPVAEARQKALTALAGLLFEETAADQEAQVARRGLQAIVKGTGMLSQQVDRTKIILHVSQAIELQSRQQSSQVIEQLEKAMEAGLDAPAAYYIIGMILSEGDRAESAIRNLQRAVKHPDYELGVRMLLGQVNYRLTRFREASVDYLEALKIADADVVGPEHSEELRQLYDPLIEAQAQQTDTDTCKRLCDNIGTLLMRSNWRLHLLQARMQLPKQAEGSPPMPMAEILTQARSGQVVEAITKMHELARTGMLRAAMFEAFYAIEFAPTYLPLHTFMGELLMKEGHIEDAVTKFSVVARSYSIRGETKRAIELWRRVIELAPMDMFARNQLIETLIARGQTEAAINEFMRLADVYYSLADLGMTRKTYTHALRLAQQANASSAIKVKVLHRMADIDMQSLDWRQALRVYEQVRTLAPDDELSRTNLLDLNLRLGQEDAAMAELDNYVTYLRGQNRGEQAIEYLERVINENPNLAAPRRRLSEAYQAVGRVEDAITQLDAAGEIYLEAGNRDAAVETIMAILALNPPNAADYQRALAEIRG